MTNECVLIDGVIYCRCGDQSSHYGTMGERGAREVRCEAPPREQVPSKELSADELREFDAAIVTIAKRQFTEANRCSSDGVCDCVHCEAGRTLVGEIERLQRLVQTWEDNRALTSLPRTAAEPSARQFDVNYQPALVFAVRELLGSLPKSRDWFSPDAERVFREFLSDARQQTVVGAAQPPSDDLKEATRLLHIVNAWFWRASDDPDSARVDPLYPARGPSSSKAPLFSAIRALLDRYPYGGATSTKPPALTPDDICPKCNRRLGEHSAEPGRFMECPRSGELDG